MKRLLSLLTVMLMLVSVFALTVTAHADFTTSSLSLAEVSFIDFRGTWFVDTITPATKTSFAVGDTVEVLVAIDGTTRADMAGLLFDYDRSVLQLQFVLDDPITEDIDESLANFTDISIWVPDGALMEVADGTAAFAVVSGTAAIENNIAVLKFKVIGIPANGSTTVNCGVKLANGSNVLYDNTNEADRDSIAINITCADHSYIEKVDAQYLVSEANCTSGAVYYKSCEHCGAASTETFTYGDPTEHTYGAWTKVDDIQHSKSCTCGDTVTEDHDWDNGTVVSEPTCVDLGVKKHVCSVCNAEKTEEYGPLLEHKPGDWTSNNDGTHTRTCTVDPDCTFSETVDCSLGEVEQHDENQHKRTCSDCGYVEYIAHDWGEGVETKAPSCADGVRTYTCVCGKTKTEAIPATGEHDYTGAEWKSDGDHKHVMKCNNCDEYKEEAHTVTGSIKHDLDYHVGTCSVCGETEAHEAHDWDDGVETVPATCVTPGVKTLTCSICNESTQEPIAPTGVHSYGEWQKYTADEHIRYCTLDSNCTASETEAHAVSGYTDYDDEHHKINCDVCGETEILADHNWGEASVTSNPTCVTEGEATYTCADCGGTKTAPVDPTNAHVWGDWSDYDDNTHIHYCTLDNDCTASETAAHAYSNNCDTLCDTCGHVRTVVHIYNCVSTADEHWNACGICGTIEEGSRAAHIIVNNECVVCGYSTSRPMSGFFYVNDDYHMMILTDGVITGHHTLDVNGDCTICGAHIAEVTEDEIVIEAPVESVTEETETESVVNPTTGLAFALISVAAAAAVAVASKKH